MDNFQFHSPTRFVFGKDTEQQVGSLVNQYGGKKILIHYGGGSVVRSGLLDRVRQSLQAAGLTYIELSGVKPNPEDTLVYEGIKLCRKENVDFILAVGGGSVIDSSKAIGLGVCYDGDFWDFYAGSAQAEKTLPVATILTIAAAGSEGSESSVITKTDGMYKRGYSDDLIRPVFSILNPALTQTLPAYQTAAGAADIMAHIFERYFTNTRNVETTDRLCEGLLLSILREVPKVLADPDDYDARANIMWAGTVAHNNIVGVGREQDWCSHGLEHELSALYGVTHGAGLAVVFPAWMKYTMSHDVMRFAQLAVRVFGCEMDFFNPERTALKGIMRLEQFWRACGLPIRMEEIGGKKEDIPYLVEHLQLKGGTSGNFVPVGEEQAAGIYEMMFEK
ncbi:MAG: iron-containing alcohol dehydrogenase [Oscillospiraceae bacterium]|nr:iron-containing alcohol dehydrogenase [Oscillospiraceae bacterium]